MATSKVIIHTPYDGSAAAISDATALDFSETKSLTQQQFVEECDINNIVNNYLKTGEITHLAASSPLYADVTEIPDFQSALNFVIEAGNAFMDLPSKIRERFNNDPQKLMDFISDNENREEAIRLGLIEAPEPPPAPSATPVADTKTETAPAAPAA